MNKIRKIRHQLGFTLIELMVVVAIIGILMAAGIVAFSDAQKTARDAKRRADVDAMSKAKEQYFMETGKYTHYPNENLGAYSFNDPNGYWTHMVTLLGFGTPLPFAQGLPLDPINNATYRYTLVACGTTSCGPGGGYHYCISARLEKPNGNCSGVGSFGTCVFTTPGTGTHHCAQNLQ